MYAKPPILQCMSTLPRTSFVVAIVFAALSNPTSAEIFEGFESSEVSWKLEQRDTEVRVIAHQRLFQGAHSGNGCEFIRINAGRGTYVHLTQKIPRSRVFAEWSPTIWIKADRPGLQFMARVVLPRATDPQTGEPMTTWLRGDQYHQVGAWQRLAIDDTERLLADQIRALRWQYRADVDASIAYVDQVALNVYGGIGKTGVWIDDLDIPIHVAASLASAPVATGESTPAPQIAAQSPPLAATARSRQIARMQGSVLVVEDRPFFPRVVQHNGESMAWLRSLGFNTVRLSRPATSVQLHEAERLDLWLVAPPPADLSQISTLHNRILAWDLGSHLGEERLELTRQLSSELRRLDLQPGRPQICQADQRIWNYSRLANLMVLDRQPLGSSLEMTDFADWIAERPRLARPGTPIWATIQVDPIDRWVQQWRTLGIEGSTASIEPEQIRMLAYHALASGARGLFFKSRTPLDGADSVSQLRARTLQLINLEAELLEPWAAGGARAGIIDSDDPNVRIGILQTDRAQMLIVLRTTPDQQFVTAPVEDEALSFIAPSLLSATHVYRIGAAGLRIQPHRRVAGGVRINLDEAGTVSLVTTTQDALVMRHLTETLARNRREVSQLHHEIAARQLELVEQTHRQLSGQSGNAPTATQFEDWLSRSRANLRHCELLLGAGDDSTARLFADRSISWLSRVRRAHWEQAAASFPSAVASPYCVSFATLPGHFEMVARLRTGGQWSANLLPAGDFESLGHLQSTGWRNLGTVDTRVRANVELAPQAAQGGRNAMRMLALPADPRDVPAELETPPVQILSPPVPVRRGQLLRIHGWANVPAEISGSVDGLMVYDSISGPQLAARIGATNGWQEFVLYRVAIDNRPISLTFALMGFGEATVDNVTVTAHESINSNTVQPYEQARRLPPVDEVRP